MVNFGKNPHTWAVNRRRTSRPPASGRPTGASGVQLGETQARLQVLAGAVQVFSDRGVRDVSVEDILGAAGISRRTFYRLYQGKEDVVAALYRLGTERLLDECRRAMADESDPILQIHRCIDAHLRNARELGRLVWVLGGESQRQESAIHDARMEVHAALVEMLMASATATQKHIDPWLIRGVVLALEGITRFALEEGDEGRQVTDESLERARRVMIRIATAALAGDGAGVAELPTWK